MNNFIVKVAVVVGVIVLLIVVSRKGKTIAARMRAKSAFKDAGIQVNLNGSTFTFNQASVAADIYDHLYNNDWFGWSEDEDGATLIVLNTPKNLMPLVENAYYVLYKKNLKADLIKYLDDKNKARITDQLNSIN